MFPDGQAGRVACSPSVCGPQALSSHRTALQPALSTVQQPHGNSHFILTRASCACHACQLGTECSSDLGICHTHRFMGTGP